MIYFIQAKSGGRVKIGRSRDPHKRVEELATGSSEPLKIIALIDAKDEVESMLHRALNGPDSFREWHKLTPALQGLIDACSAGVDLGPLLDSIVVLRSVSRRAKRFEEQAKTPKKRRPSRKMNLSKAERKRRSDAMKQRIAEGKAGAQFGKLGGRPPGS